MRQFIPLRYLLISLFLLGGNFSFAQTQSLFDKYYEVENDVVIDEIDKMQIALDGNDVNMIPFRESKMYGFVSPTTKEWIIKPKYDEVFAVYNEGAIVKSGYYYGLVNEKEEWLIEPIHQNLFKVQDIFYGIANGQVIGENRYLPIKYRNCIINKYYSNTGELIFTQKAHEQSSFTGIDTLAWYRFGTEYIIRGISGKIHQTFQVNASKHFLGISNNTLVFSERINKKNHYVGYSANMIETFKVPVKYKNVLSVTQLSDNLFGLIWSDNQYMFFDKQGNKKPYSLRSGIAGIYESDLSFFEQEYYAVMDEETNLVGVVDKQGKVLVDFKYNHIGSFKDGIAFFVKNKYEKGFVQINGKELELDEYKKEVLRNLDVELFAMMSANVEFKEGLCIGKFEQVFVSKTLIDAYKQIDYEKVVSKNGDSLYVYRVGHDEKLYFYFDKNFNIQLYIKPEVIFVGNFSEGLAPAVNKERKLGFINKQGEWAIQPEYDLQLTGRYLNMYVAIPEFKGGYAYIKSFKGYIDKDGKAYFSGERVQDKYNFSH